MLGWKGKKSVLRIAGSVLFVYAGVTAGMFCLQKRLLFQPFRELEATPAESNLASREVWLDTADGVRLHAWWLPANSGAADAAGIPTDGAAAPDAALGRGAVLICHGNGGNISHMIGKAEMWHRAGWSVLLFDYRGYGRSGGSVSETGLYADADAAWDWLTASRHVPPEKIVLHGFSMGGAVAAHLAQGKGAAAAGLVLESSFFSVPDVAARHYPYLPVRLLLRYRFPTGEFLKGVHMPVAVLHSPADEVVPYENGQRLFAAAAEPKRFIETRGGHNDAKLESDPMLHRQLLDTAAAWPAK